MKNIYVKSLVILSLLFQFSCNNDDNGAETDTLEEGTYVLTSVSFTDIIDQFEFENIPETGVDINEDGVISENVVDELPCFRSTITFDAESRFISTDVNIRESERPDGDYEISCDGFESRKGSYVFNGNFIILDFDPIDEESNTLESVSYDIRIAEKGIILISLMDEVETEYYFEKENNK